MGLFAILIWYIGWRAGKNSMGWKNIEVTPAFDVISFLLIHLAGIIMIVASLWRTFR